MTNFQKKKGLFGTKKQAGAKLKKKKKDFCPKNWPILKKKEKKGTFPTKKKAGAELKNQKMTFSAKNCEKNWV